MGCRHGVGLQLAKIGGSVRKLHTRPAREAQSPEDRVKARTSVVSAFFADIVEAVVSWF